MRIGPAGQAETSTTSAPLDDAFRHEALFYSGPDEFVERSAAFIEAGLSAREPVLVLVVDQKIQSLRDSLGSDDADKVLWGDMTEIGRNPGRIISAWREFADEYASSGRVRGIGEPIWRGRTSEELVESQRHESLINLAFTGTPGWILCPYDLNTLDPAVIDEAYRSHPFVTAGGIHGSSDTYRNLDEIARPFADPLLEPAGEQERFTLTATELHEMRAIVSQRALEFGIARDRVQDFVLAVNEVATNSLTHGEGRAVLRLWSTPSELICEVSDEGKMDAPLAGRQRPTVGGDSGYGLWMANQLSDLVELRSFPTGSVVRLHISRR
jgi:anti-sigma regulatory factor (Ser/Thr protein kinase)